MKRCLPQHLLPPLLIILAGVMAYWNSYDGVFLYDGIGSIRDNPHIRVLWPLSESMSLPLWNSSIAIDSRPLLSFTFALNHHVLGPDPWGYHLVNLVIHIGAALLLFSVVRRTLALPQFCERYSRNATGLSLSVALIWLLHPLHTESVTYMAQRAESLMGMLYLLTLYCAIRGFGSGSGIQIHALASAATDEERSRGRQAVDGRTWYLASVLVCAVGMGVKQVMVTAPLLVLIYDGIFVSSSWREVLTMRWRLYAALCSTWLIILGIIVVTWEEATSDFAQVSPLRYALTQPLVILHYLRLSFWPSPLVFSYSWPLEDAWPRIVFPLLLILGMLAVMFHGLWRRTWIGFLAAWFFLILAPTSSISPLRQMIFEHRMYLSVAALVVLAVFGFEHVMRKWTLSPKRRARVGGCATMAVAIVFACLTNDRNKDYHSELKMWQDNVKHRPQSFQAQCNLGDALKADGRMTDAIAHYRTCLDIRPDYARAHNGLGNALQSLGRLEEAIHHYREALRHEPEYAEAHNNWGLALEADGQRQDAIHHYQEAVRIEPDMAKAHVNLGNALQATGRTRDALDHYQQAVQAKPDYTDAYNNLGNALLLLGQHDEAVLNYREALRIDPDYTEAHYGWGIALAATGRLPQAIKHFEQVLRLNPNHAGAREHLHRTRAMLEPGGQE